MRNMFFIDSDLFSSFTDGKINTDNVDLFIGFRLVKIIPFILRITINIDSVLFVLQIIRLIGTPIDVSCRFSIGVGEYSFLIDIIDTEPNFFVW